MYLTLMNGWCEVRMFLAFKDSQLGKFEKITM